MYEFEAKFTGVNIKEIKNKLSKAGFQCSKPETFMKRKTFHIKGNENKWGRVRDEGDKITLTIKEVIKKDALDGVKEGEVVINDFKSGCLVLKMSGFYEVSFQETKREIWQRDTVEVMIDTWPGLKPFIEIEAPDEKTVRKICLELGYDIKKALFGGVDGIYKQELNIEPDVVNKMAIITFKNPPTAA